LDQVVEASVTTRETLASFVARSILIFHSSTMGVKIVYTTVGFIGTSSILMLTALMMPQHTLSFFSLYGVRVARMWIYTMSVQTESSGNDFCRALRTMVSDDRLGWCDNLDTMTDIQDVQQRFCSQAFNHIWPSFCNGLSQGYALGTMVVMIIVLNLGLQAAAIYLLLDYAGRKANPKYRRASMIALSVGLSMLMLTLLYYGVEVLQNLDSVQSAGPLSSVFSAVLSTSKGTGVSRGYMMLWVAALFQIVALVLYSQVQWDKEESKYRENKAVREYEEENLRMQMQAGYGAAGPSSGGAVPMASAAPGQGGGFPQPGFQQPQPGFQQPQPGLQMQGFAQPQGFSGQQGGDFGI